MKKGAGVIRTLFLCSISLLYQFLPGIGHSFRFYFPYVFSGLRGKSSNRGLTGFSKFGKLHGDLLYQAAEKVFFQCGIPPAAGSRG